VSTLTRRHCHEIARELLISAHHENRPEAKRAFLRLSRTWVNLALVARARGPIHFRGRSV
jgi:hypothetical protein